MNIMGFLTGLFRGTDMDGQLEPIRQRARQDAQTTVGEYMREFESEAARILFQGQQRLLGAPTVDERGQDSIESQEAAVPDYRTWKRPELMREAKARGIQTEKGDTKDDLASKLEGFHTGEER